MKPRRALALGVALAGLSFFLGDATCAADGLATSAPQLLPGIGSHDPRVPVRVDALPWRAIGKLQATSGSLYESCTGTLVGQALVLTAAHCVFNPRTQRDFPPSSLHFLVGYDRGHYAGHAIGRRIEVGAGYDPRRPAATRGSDWALILLDKPLGAGGRTLPIMAQPPSIGAAIMLGGYSQDHPLILMADTGCRIIGRIADGAGRPLLRHDCTGGAGVSGAPMLIARSGGWCVAAIAVAAEMGAASGVAALPTEARRLALREGSVEGRNRSHQR
jgi:protease YdgD